MLLFFPLLMRLALHWSVILARTFFPLLNKRIHFKKTSQVHLQTEVCSSAACKGGKAQYN